MIMNLQKTNINKLNTIEDISDEILEEVVEVETHLHSNERWFEKAATPNGEIHVADRIGTVGGNGAFQIDAGNNTWGTWKIVLGSSDTPADSGKTKFDVHRIEISGAERNAIYFVQMAAGETGAAALAVGNVTEFVIKPLSNQIDSGPIMVQSKRAESGTKIWARCMCPGQDTATLDFFPGIHEYDE
jgi:hypothetical protein